MTTSNFTTHSATVLEGQPVTFDDTINGGAVHILCVGSGTGGEGSDHCDSATQAADAPAVLVGQGLIIMAGEKKQITFPTAGSYHVICTVHPGMYIDITAK
jgi:plastocyanin